jgi:dTDP-4-amino-4,6-dideoxygalactose transaminase
MMNIPFVDLKAQYRTIKPEIDLAIQSVIAETAFIGGKYVNDFNSKFAKAIGVKHCIGVANGTDAIYIVMKMLGIGTGDEVITTASSWIATSETISETGAKPVFVDIEPDYYTIDVSKIEAKINENTKAIIPVHLYGQMSDMDALVELCKKHNLWLIEDCAQSHLSAYNDTIAGNFGVCGTFSFYPGKNLGAYGDAGSIVTNDDKLAQNCRRYANHGQLSKHDHKFEGISSRLDGLQAAILSVKLDHLQSWIDRRIEIAKIYDELLGDNDNIKLPKLRPNATHFNHRPEQFPNAFAHQNEALSIPIYPELTDDMIEYVADAVNSFTT